MQNRTQTQTLIFIFEYNVRNKAKDPQNTVITSFVKTNTQSKNCRKKPKCKSIYKPNAKSIHQKIHNALIKINVFNDDTNDSEKNDIEQRQNKECQLTNNVHGNTTKENVKCHITNINTQEINFEKLQHQVNTSI